MDPMPVTATVERHVDDSVTLYLTIHTDYTPHPVTSVRFTSGDWFDFVRRVMGVVNIYDDGSGQRHRAT